MLQSSLGHENLFCNQKWCCLGQIKLNWKGNKHEDRVMTQWGVDLCRHKKLFKIKNNSQIYLKYLREIKSMS